MPLGGLTRRWADAPAAAGLGVVYDFRNPPQSGMDNPSFYAAILDQVAWLDGLGLDLVWFTEHHFLDDGYLPSGYRLPAAMAARTKHVRFSTDICLIAVQPPVRLAEDLAVLDNLSNGRIEVVSAWATHRTSFAASASRWRNGCRVPMKVCRC